MEDEKRNLQIARNIWTILRNSSSIVMSWGLDPATVKPIDCGIRFHVQGYKHTGNVEVKLNEGADLYEVYLYEDDGKLKTSFTDIYVDQLIGTIDGAVEYTGGDYEEKVNATYPLLQSVQQIIIV